MLGAAALAHGHVAGSPYDGQNPDCMPIVSREQTDTQPEIRTGSCGPDNAELLLKGKRHTSTNFLGAVLQHNLGHNACRDPKGLCCLSASLLEVCSAGVNEPSNTTYCCWKHGYANHDCPYPNRQPGQPYPVGAFIARSPYPWLLSMFNHPYEYLNGGHMNFSQFIRARFDYAPVRACDTSVSTWAVF